MSTPNLVVVEVTSFKGLVVLRLTMFSIGLGCHGGQHWSIISYNKLWEPLGLEAAVQWGRCYN